MRVRIKTITCTSVTYEQVKSLAGICDCGRILMPFKSRLKTGQSTERETYGETMKLLRPVSLTAVTLTLQVDVNICETKIGKQCELHWFI